MKQTTEFTFEHVRQKKSLISVLLKVWIEY